MKKVIFLLCIVFIIGCVFASAQETAGQASGKKPRFDVGAGYWYTWASLDNEHVAVRDNPGFWLKGQKVEEINYDNDGGLFIVNADAYLFWRLYADGLIGWGDIDDAEQVISEWSPVISSAKETESISDANGDVTTWNINGHFRVLEKPEDNNYLDLSLGYLYYQDDFEELPNLIEIISNFETVNNPISGADEDSDKYTFDGIRLGARARLKFHERFAVKGNIGISPWLDAEREARFNLNASPNDPNVLGNDIDAESDAFGIDAAIGIEFKVTENIFIEAGYKYINIDSDVGDRTYSWADGTVLEFDSGWKNAEVERGGIYAMGRVKI